MYNNNNLEEFINDINKIQKNKDEKKPLLEKNVFEGCGCLRKGKKKEKKSKFQKGSIIPKRKKKKLYNPISKKEY